jgi:hypothetical protein
MNKSSLEKFLAAMGWKAKSWSLDWVTVSCPFAKWRHQKGTDNNPSFGLSITPGGHSWSHCFACNYHNDLSTMVYELRHLHGDETKQLFNLKAALQLIASEEEDAIEEAFDFSKQILSDQDDGDNPFPQWWVDSFPSALESGQALSYLHSRSVPVPVVQALDLRWDGLQKRVCFPVRDYKKQVRGLHGRAIFKGIEPTYRMYVFQQKNNPIVWLGEHWIDPEKPIVVTESCFDLASVYRVYRNVICPLTASLSEAKIKRLQKLDGFHYVTMFDGDKAGQQAEKKFKAVLKPPIYKRVLLPEETDPGEMSTTEIMDRLADHVDFDPVLS